MNVEGMGHKYAPYLLQHVKLSTRYCDNVFCHLILKRLIDIVSIIPHTVDVRKFMLSKFKNIRWDPGSSDREMSSVMKRNVRKS